MPNITKERWSYIQDQLSVLSMTGMQENCIGGKPNVSGYCCIHCGSVSPSTVCRGKKIYRERDPDAKNDLEDAGEDLRKWKAA